MLIYILLTSIWAVLMLRSGIAEYKYYQSLKTLQPQVWEKLGAPVFLKIPMPFVSRKNSALLKNIKNQTVCGLAKKHRQAGRLFLSYVVLVLLGSIVYFKTA